jgi:hypothetical protein
VDVDADVLADVDADVLVGVVAGGVVRVGHHTSSCTMRQAWHRASPAATGFPSTLRPDLDAPADRP